MGTRRGWFEDFTDELADEHPAFAALIGASLQGGVAFGERAGQPVRRLLADPRQASLSGRLCATARGFSLHAARRVKAHQRGRLEQLCRYVARPPVANSRLSRVDADTLTYELKTPWSDGTTHVVFSPTELISRLAALVPPKRMHQVRFHGVLAPHAKHRRLVVPPPEEKDDDNEAAETDEPIKPTYRIAWSALLKRVFDIDVRCRKCHEPLKLVALITDVSVAARILESLGLPSQAPPVAPARPPPQSRFEFDAA